MGKVRATHSTNSLSPVPRPQFLQHKFTVPSSSSQFLSVIAAATAFCAGRNVLLAEIEQLTPGILDRLQRIDDSVNTLIAPDPLRREFLGHERLVNTLFGAVKPDPAALEFAGRVACITAIADAIRAKLNPNPADITEVMGQVREVLDASITGVEMLATPVPVLDLSKIDFAALAKRLKKTKHKNTGAPGTGKACHLPGVLAPLQGAIHTLLIPGVSLRSTPGYVLASRRDAARHVAHVGPPCAAAMERGYCAR